MAEKVSFTLNGKSVSVTTEGQRPLLWVLRTEFALTGTKFGCGHAYCGACTVLVDNKAVRSCVYPLRNVDGREVMTIEGLAKDGELHPLQQAFVAHDAFQCGYCTPGMIMTAKAFLNENPHPSEEEVKEALSGNFCRCISHYQVIKAVMSVADGS